jgi:lysozyme family protein
MEKYQHILPHILKWEGGLSNDKKDSASKNPCPVPYKGVSGYHTNRGITWTTFCAYCKDFKLDPLTKTDEFFTITPEVAGKIFKRLYWDRVKADFVDSVPVANCLAQWAWGSGSAGAWNILIKYINRLGKNADKWGSAIDVLNARCKELGAKQVFKELCDCREAFFKEIAKPGSNNSKFLQGWLNRLESFKKFNEPLFNL